MKFDIEREGRIILRFCVFLLCFLYFVSCNTIKNSVLKEKEGNSISEKKETALPNDYQKSFLVLAGELKSGHPGLVESPLPALSMDDFESLVNETYIKLAEADNYRDFFFMVSPFLSLLNDGHSGVFYGPMEKRIIPCSLTWIGSELFISKVFDPQYSHLAGKEVIRIGNYDTPDFEAKINGLRQTDENNLYHLRKEQFGSNYFMMIYDTYAYFNMLDNDSIAFTLKEGAETEEQTLPFMQMGEMGEEDFFILARNPITLCTYKNGYKVMEDLSTLYFQLGTDELTSQMIKEIFETIKEKGLENLVIDLRNSGGGEAAEEAVEFFDYLTLKAVIIMVLRGGSGKRIRLLK